MGSINKSAFKAWLIKKRPEPLTYGQQLVIKDTVSRADRVRRAFEAINPMFSYENKINKDNGESLWKLLSRRGKCMPTDIPLPVGSNQMDSITHAAKQYILFLREMHD